MAVLFVVAWILLIAVTIRRGQRLKDMGVKDEDNPYICEPPKEPDDWVPPLDDD